MYKIGICGAHGTGKTTLTELISSELKIKSLAKTTTNFWPSVGVNNFELLPPDVRTVFQNHLLLNHIQTEDEQNTKSNDYVTDRTVIDYLAHTILDTTKSASELGIYRTLVNERIKNYTHIIYCPIEFEVEERDLRADLNKRQDIDTIILNFLNQNYANKFLTVTGSVEERMIQIKKFLSH
jgi:deoxyadenosine/deoxycytidine kinase